MLEVRGLQGNSVDRDRHDRLPRGHGGPGKKYEIVEVVGSWDDGKAQKAVADALAVHGKFDAMFVQGGSTGAIARCWTPGQPDPGGDRGRERRAQADRQVPTRG